MLAFKHRIWSVLGLDWVILRLLVERRFGINLYTALKASIYTIQNDPEQLSIYDV